MSKIESGPWKGWVWNKALGLHERGFVNDVTEKNVVWVYENGELWVNVVRVNCYDTPAQARQAAEGLVRGPVRWADEVEG